MNLKLLITMCCLTVSATAQSEPARQLYALNCMGCHAIVTENHAFHSQTSYSAEFWQEPKKRHFFIRIPEPGRVLDETENRELIAEILAWAKACPQIPPGMPLNRPRLTTAQGK